MKTISWVFLRAPRKLQDLKKMKVKKEIVSAAIVKLLTNITATMPTSTYKFLMGGMSAFATMKGLGKIEEMMDVITDLDGLVDIDVLQNMIASAFTASGGTLQIDLFNGNGLMSMIVKPLKLNITMADIEPIMAEIRANAVQEPAPLSAIAQPPVQQPQQAQQQPKS